MYCELEALPNERFKKDEEGKEANKTTEESTQASSQTSAAPEKVLGKCGGPIKPCITFFGQALPKRFFECWEMIHGEKDTEGNYKFPEHERGCDLMIVIGTALAVNPFCNTIV